ncbi:MAG: polysaccharide deacetylase family protein [Clostridia bacterium]|nr:polysaccharide deacetylase family protein [Clostridia bacterium]
MKKTVVSLSFDDGREDTIRNAFSIMNKYGLKATVHITTGFVDGTWDGHKWDSCDKAMTVADAVQMHNSGFEISLHGDKHKTEIDDFLISKKKLKSWGISVENIGFSIPNSDLNDTQRTEFTTFLKNEGVLYMRGGRNAKCYSFVSKCFFALYKIFKFQFAYNLFNKYNRNINYDKYDLNSVVVRNEDKAKTVIRFIEKYKNDSWIILMLHSVLSKNEEKYGSDAWYWDSEEFETLCKYLSQAQSNGKIEVKTIIDNIN